MMFNSIVNYNAERELFNHFVELESNPTILLIHGEAGLGKSTLVEFCIRNLTERAVIHLELDNTTEALPRLLIRLVDEFKAKNLPTFIEIIASLLNEEDKKDDPLWIIDINSHIKRIGESNNFSSHYEDLSKAWFYDANLSEKPILLNVRDYDKSSPRFKKWFSEIFLAKAAETQGIHVLISGREVPSIEKYDAWKAAAKVHELKGVHDPDVWLEWAVAVGYKPSLPDMTRIVEDNNGNPRDIVAQLEVEFPRTNETSSPTTDLPNKIAKYFLVNDLKNLCEELGIVYENLPFPDREVLNSLAREMVGYMMRANRLPDLIKICKSHRTQVEWP